MRLAAILLSLAIIMINGAPSFADAIPARAKKYRALLVREARMAWGMGAPVATFAAQIHQESTWKEDARSHAGAEGLAQFMPATARWLPTVSPRTGEPMPYSPSWAIRAMLEYDKYLWRKVPPAASDCDRWAFVLSAYNGGLGWLRRDCSLAAEYGLDATRWDGVRIVNAGRSVRNFDENRGYPERILRRWTPVYREAGWGRGGCDAR